MLHTDDPDAPTWAPYAALVVCALAAALTALFLAGTHAGAALMGADVAGLPARSWAHEGVGRAVAVLAPAVLLVRAGWNHTSAPTVVVVSKAVAALVVAALTLTVGFRLVASVTGRPVLGLVLAAGVAGAVYRWGHWVCVDHPSPDYPSVRRQEIWWAQVPFEDGAGAKDRPALVLSTSARHVRVLMFTSKDKSARAGYVPVPSSVWARPVGQSWLRTDRVIRIRKEKLRRREGVVDDATWNAARR